MIKIQSESFFRAFFAEKYKDKIEKLISNLNKKFVNFELGFFDIDKETQLLKIKEFVFQNKTQFDHVVVLGIGGSALGTRALLTALNGKLFNEFKKEKRNNNPTLHIIDNIDPSEIKEILNVIDITKTLFIVISKSGTTIETISQYEFFKSKIENCSLEYKKHFVVITGENSKLKEISIDQGLTVFTIPENVGGRFSALSAVGLLPLAMVGIDIDRLLLGIKKVKKDYLDINLEKNLALYLALIQYYEYYENKKNITVFCPYSTNMQYFSQWYKQLIAESLGKEGLGITLVDAIGVTDQHSQLQLYYDGPDDKLIIFLDIMDFGVDYKINQKMTFGELMKIEKKSTQISLNQVNRSNISIEIDSINEENLSALILLFEMQIAYLGELLEINAYNQPGVEKCKIVMKKLLEN